MKYLMLALLLIAGSVQAASDYTLKKGISWTGVKIGNSTVSGSDFICRNAECYPLGDVVIPQEMKSRYQIERFSFSGLQHTATAGDEERITLPADLGQRLFIRSRQLYNIDNSSRNIWLNN